MVEKGDRLALLARPPSAPDSVHVGLEVARHVEVDHVCHIWDVEAASGDVGRDHDRPLARHKLSQTLVAVGLLFVSVNAASAKAFLPERLGDVINPPLGVGEHDHLVVLARRIFCQNFVERGVLFAVVQLVELLAHGRVRSELVRLVADRKPNAARLEVICRHLAHRLGPRCREEQALPRSRGSALADQEFDFRLEAHIEHAIRFVQHQIGHCAQCRGFGLEQILHAPRGRDHEVGVGLELLDLRPLRHATVHLARRDLEGGAEFGRLVVDLHS
mmetsp:Transcript_74053/g.211431  ORF Transcript_74053/g.211431 Transcript_74053/m.211431 type:complete len:274 (+) Transcript_74053:148-969(+)